MLKYLSWKTLAWAMIGEGLALAIAPGHYLTTWQRIFKGIEKLFTWLNSMHKYSRALGAIEVVAGLLILLSKD